MLDPGTLKVLSENGWTPSRRVSTGEDTAALSASGYGTWPSLLSFLSSFSGVVLKFDRAGTPDEAFLLGLNQTDCSRHW